MGQINLQNKSKASVINVDAYLKRIGERREEPSLDYLRRIHRAHLLHIPFENLDIHYNQKIILDYSRIFNKVVRRGRGGYCYELNGLFYLLLHHLGFKCHLISARVKNEKTGEFGKEYDHMAILVRFGENDFLVDVGFGKGFIYPKTIEAKLVQMDYTNYWRVIQDPDENFFLQVSEDARIFSSKYLFSTSPKKMIQFMEMNEYQQSSPESTFTHQKLITKLTETGRITLTSRKFIHLELGQTSETELVNEDEFLSKLDQHFGISLKQLVLNND